MNYFNYSKAINNQQLPLAIVDLDILQQNLIDIIKRCEERKIRIASKSIRSVEMLKYILNFSEQIQGIMCFTLEELNFLCEQNFDDLLLAYPDFQPNQLEKVALNIKNGKKITLMVDLENHLDVLNNLAKKHNIIIPVCMDLDMSSTVFGIYFGVYRSSIKTKNNITEFLKILSKYPNLKLNGLMGYEAQIAGVGDNLNNQYFKNLVIKLLKKISVKEIAIRRQEAVHTIEKILGYKLEIVNGGGTGSIESTLKEKCITEVTVGSGIYSSHLFDNYVAFKHKPAAFFAIQITRNPNQNIYTAHGGGYIASGSTEVIKAPKPYLPEGMHLLKNEGAGEVQTPLFYKGKLEIGSPVFFRHAKAGELCERFNELTIISNNKIVDCFKTYRGEGKAFL